MLSSKTCCVPGCIEKGVTHQVLHKFPRDPSRFNIWLNAIGGEIMEQHTDFILNNRRVCRSHFELKHWCRYERLTKSAIPTLHMPDKSSNSHHEHDEVFNSQSSSMHDTPTAQCRPFTPCSEQIQEFMHPSSSSNRHRQEEVLILQSSSMHDTATFQCRPLTPHSEQKHEPAFIAMGIIEDEVRKESEAENGTVKQEQESDFLALGDEIWNESEEENEIEEQEPDFVAMAIVEDEVRNESEEENEIDVVVEYEGDHDSESEDDDDVVDEALERKVAALELKIKEDPYAYDDHMELVKALWALSDLERWREAFDRVANRMALKPEDWLERIQTEMSLSHSSEARERIAVLFEKATEDCYSIKILSEWCAFSLSEDNSPADARQYLKKVVDCAGADPISGKVFWDALFECEKAVLETLMESDTNKEEYQKQRERVCRSLEEAVSRPLMRGSDALPLYVEYAIPTASYGPEYVARTKKDHILALKFLQELTPFEDSLLTAQTQEEKLKIYEEYIDTVKNLLKGDKYTKRDGEATLKVLYDRATTECPTLALVQGYARHIKECFSSSAYRRVIRACSRRWPRTHHFWTLMMQQAERDQKGLEEVNSIFESALLRGMESYKEGEQLWLSYIEYKRRQTDSKSQEDAEHMRNTFRLAWDSLATLYGDEANDCEIPLYWARFEYQHSCPKEGREVFEEIFRYGENRTMSKYWESMIRLEMSRMPATSEEKLRALFRRALKAVTDYPPAIATLWTDYERDFGTHLEAFVECADTCENKILEWREYYKTMKEKMTGKKQYPKQMNKKNKFDKNKNNNKDEPGQSKKHNDKSKIKGKRKSDSTEDVVPKKGREEMEVDEPEKESGTGVKRSHEDDATDIAIKRLKTETNDAREISREACTLFVSNLDFKFDEDELRQNLSQYGDIVHFRVRKGTKAFGGAICYCQYINIDAVDNALKHDRSLLGGRPMFFSRYAAKKTRAEFKYSTEQESNKLFVKNLPFAHCTKEKLTQIFEPHGNLKDIRIVTLKDGKPRGLAYVDYEDETSAAAAIQHTNGMLVGERKIEVAISAPPPKDTPAPSSLGLPKRDAGGGMRRTQLSSFIPSVLQRASTSKAPVPQPNDAGPQNKPKSNSDFRSLLLASKK